jgi:hypothetical protein
MLVEFEVTAEDIEGADNSTNNCAVARALHRAGFPDVIVGFSTVGTPVHMHQYDLDERTAQKIWHFTQTRKMEPFTATMTERTT